MAAGTNYPNYDVAYRSAVDRAKRYRKPYSIVQDRLAGRWYVLPAASYAAASGRRKWPPSRFTLRRVVDPPKPRGRSQKARLEAALREEVKHGR